MSLIGIRKDLIFFLVTQYENSDQDPFRLCSGSGKIEPKQIHMDLELFESLIRIKKLQRRNRIILMKADHQTDAAPQYCLNYWIRI
jgi:hypothetical protein